MSGNNAQEETAPKIIEIIGPDGLQQIPDPFVKPKVPHEVGKYNPLQWATFKGHYHIVWILLKNGLKPLDFDMHGNTAIHQAAASGVREMIECYLSLGVDVEIKNARGHTPFDMATKADIKALVIKAIKTTKCSSLGCPTKFDF